MLTATELYALHGGFYGRVCSFSAEERLKSFTETLDDHRETHPAHLASGLTFLSAQLHRAGAGASSVASELLQGQAQGCGTA